MLLSFDAKQKLKLSVTRNKEYLSKYLLEEERVRWSNAGLQKIST